MSLITKIFIVLTAIMAVVFLMIAGTLSAKQENFKVRAYAEKINRVHEEEIADRFISRYNSLMDRKNKILTKSRENILYANTKVALTKAKFDVAKQATDDVTASLERFANVRSKFDSVVNDYSAMFENIMNSVTQISENRNDTVVKRSALWKNLTSIEAKAGHLREEINLFDYNLYKLRKNNREKRQTLEIFRQVEPDSFIPGLESAPNLKNAQVISYDKDNGLVEINHGYTSNVESKQVFSIIRDGGLVAKIEITNVQADSSVGRILAGTKIKDVKLGDAVKPAAFIN